LTHFDFGIFFFLCSGSLRKVIRTLLISPTAVFLPNVTIRDSYFEDNPDRSNIDNGEPLVSVVSANLVITNTIFTSTSISGPALGVFDKANADIRGCTFTKLIEGMIFFSACFSPRQEFDG
jgi:hypothetical protein